jgi:hypothetical protein
MRAPVLLCFMLPFALACGQSHPVAPASADVSAASVSASRRRPALTHTLVLNACAGEEVEFRGIALESHVRARKQGTGVRVLVAPEADRARGTGLVSGKRYEARAMAELQFDFPELPAHGRGFLAYEVSGPGLTRRSRMRALFDAEASAMGEVALIARYSIECGQPAS